MAVPGFEPGSSGSQPLMLTTTLYHQITTWWSSGFCFQEFILVLLMPPALYRYGGLAHLVERSVRNRQAGGSKPPSSTAFCFLCIHRGGREAGREDWICCFVELFVYWGWTAHPSFHLFCTVDIFFVYLCVFRQRVRVVKELVLKANGLCPREFKSRRCRFFLFVFLQWNFLFYVLCVRIESTTKKKHKKI